MSRADEIEDLPDIDGDRPPRLTREIIGHDTAFDAFTQARSQGRLHHSWLLSGIKGIGKASFAYQLSRHLLHDTPVDTPVQNVIEGDSPAVQLIESGTHPDLFVLSRSYNRDTDKFRTDIPIDDVRRMKSFFQLTSVGRNWRICIIDSLDEMNRYSLNSLLKILEEPPEKSIFLLVSHRVWRRAGYYPLAQSSARFQTADFVPSRAPDYNPEDEHCTGRSSSSGISGGWEHANGVNSCRIGRVRPVSGNGVFAGWLAAP